MSKPIYVDLDFQNTFRGINVPNPSAAGHVANKSYIDNAILGINTPIGVKARSSTNVDISQLNNGDSVGGATVSTGDIVFLDGQTTATEDGAYVVGATAGSTVRSTLLSAGEDARGLLVVVESGTFAGNLFLQTANPAIVGTNGLTLTGPLAAGVTYSADGQGIELTSTTFSLELDGTTLAKSASGLRVGSGAAGAGLVESSGVLAVGDGGEGVTVNADNVALDFSTVSRWRTALGPASAGSSIVQAHNLGHKALVVQVKRESDGLDITDGVEVTVDATNITVTFGASQADRSAFRINWTG